MLHIEYYTGKEGFDLNAKPLTDRGTTNVYRRRADLGDILDLLVEGYNNIFNSK